MGTDKDVREMKELLGSLRMLCNNHRIRVKDVDVHELDSLRSFHEAVKWIVDKREGPEVVREEPKLNWLCRLLGHKWRSNIDGLPPIAASRLTPRRWCVRKGCEAESNFSHPTSDPQRREVAS